jgi:MFS family permease
MPKVGQLQVSEQRWTFVLRAFRYRNYRLFFTGQSLSLIGTWMTRIATSWLVYRLTGSALLLGAVGFAGQIPTFLLAPFAGVWVDRLNRHRVLVVTQVLAMLQSLALALLAISGDITVAEVIWLGAFQGLINAFDMPARQAFVVEMVEDRKDVSNAIALNSSMVNMARLIGPSLAGIVIAGFGEGYCFLIDGISYLAVIGSLLLMRVKPTVARTVHSNMLTELKEGWVYVSGSPAIRALLLLLALVSLVGMPYTVLMPIFAANILHGGPHTLGFLMGASGVGALAGAIELASRRSVLGLGRVVAISAGLFGVGLITFSQSRWLWLSLALMLLTGMGMMRQMAATNTILQTIVEEEKRGRVMSYYTMAFVGIAPFGSLLAGIMAAHLGASPTLLITGVCCVLGAVWFGMHLEELRRVVRPIYASLGILPEMATAIQSASALRTPPEE